MSETLPTNDSEQAIGVDRGALQYPSAAESGHIEIELPTLKGSPHSTERLLARDFGPHVIGKIEAAMNRQPYMSSGTQQNPVQILKHFTAVAKGAGIVDPGTLGRMKELGDEFEREPEQDEYYRQVVRPWLLSLVPRRR